MAIYSSILACDIPQTEEPGSYSPWGHKELDMTEQLTLPLPLLKHYMKFLGPSQKTPSLKEANTECTSQFMRP